MTVMTIRNLPEEVRRALRVRASRHGRSTEAEVRAILEEAVRPKGRVKLGSLLAEVGRKVRLTDEELELINARSPSAPRPVNFE